MFELLKEIFWIKSESKESVIEYIALFSGIIAFIIFTVLVWALM